MKSTRAPCRRNPDDQADRIEIADTFGDMVTADQKVLNEEQQSKLHHKYAVVVQALATPWIQSYPCNTKLGPGSQRSLRKFLRPEENTGSIYLENSLELIKACEELNWNHERSTPPWTRPTAPGYGDTSEALASGNI